MYINFAWERKNGEGKNIQINDRNQKQISRQNDGRQLLYYPVQTAAMPVGPPIFFYPAPAGEEKPPQEDLESTEIRPPPAGSSVAEAQPVGIAIAGPGGVASAQPVGTAVVGPGGLAIARPVGTAIAGVPGIVGPLGGGPPPIAEVEEPPKITVYYTAPVIHAHPQPIYLY